MWILGTLEALDLSPSPSISLCLTPSPRGSLLISPFHIPDLQSVEPHGEEAIGGVCLGHHCS